MTEARQQDYSEGMCEGWSMAEGGEKFTVARLEGQVRMLQERLDEATRVFKVDGDQVVQVGRCACR